MHHDRIEARIQLVDARDHMLSEFDRRNLSALQCFEKFFSRAVVPVNACNGARLLSQSPMSPCIPPNCTRDRYRTGRYQKVAPTLVFHDYVLRANSERSRSGNMRTTGPLLSLSASKHSGSQNTACYTNFQLRRSGAFTRFSSAHGCGGVRNTIGRHLPAPCPLVPGPLSARPSAGGLTPSMGVSAGIEACGSCFSLTTIT
jgi:hypothetical protein